MIEKNEKEEEDVPVEEKPQILHFEPQKSATQGPITATSRGEKLLRTKHEHYISQDGTVEFYDVPVTTKYEWDEATMVFIQMNANTVIKTDNKA